MAQKRKQLKLSWRHKRLVYQGKLAKQEKNVLKHTQKLSNRVCYGCALTKL